MSVSTLPPPADAPLTADALLATDAQLERFALLNPEQRAACLSRSPGLRSATSVARLLEDSRKQVRVNFQRALCFADAALDIATQLNDCQAIGRSLRMKANALHASGQNREALDLHQQALATFRGCDSAEEEALTLSARVQPLLLVGRYDQAFSDAERARAIFSSLGNRRRCARLEINVGNIFHRQDRFEEAIVRYEAALAQLVEERDAEGIAGALSNLAVCLISTNDFPRALAAHQRARELCRQNDMPLLAAQTDYNIAYLYFLRGEYNVAIEMLRRVRLDCERVGDAYHHALCNLDLSEIYLELNLSDEAADMARQGAARFDELGMGYEAAKSQAFLAVALQQQHKEFRALELFASARQRFKGEQNRPWMALVDLYRAMVFAEEGRIYEARQLAQAALRFFDGSMLPAKAVLCRLLLARLSLREGNISQAERECVSALVALQNCETPSLAFHAHFLHGCIAAATGTHTDAYAAFRNAREALEKLRGGLRLDELKISFLKNKLEVYEYLVELSLDFETQPNHEPRETFGYIEEAKSRSLVELMLHPRDSQAGEGEAQSELVRRIRRLRQELNWYYHRIEREQFAAESGERVQSLQQALRHREREFASAVRELPTGDSGARLASALPVDEVRAALAPGVVLIEYFRAHERLLAVVLSRERFQIVPISLAGKVDNSLRLLQLQLAKFRLGSDYVRKFGPSLLISVQAHLAALYRDLIAPLDLEGAGHLVIVPHESLHQLPFHALRDTHGYLIDRVSLSYAPSASVHTLCQRSESVASGTGLVLGVSDERAPAIEREARAVAARLDDSTLLLGRDATHDALRRMAPRCRVIHVASHGYFRDDNPRFSGLRVGDSYLSTHDLAQLNLAADLVTLSGCATGLNAVSGGDELIGLERALLAAGARSLLLSLWGVDDESTAELMQSFYSHFQNGRGLAQSLRLAMLELKQQFPHPYYWAPFFLVGSH